ncbi:MAG: BREX-1 system adenine-specific DNA-methyltransferase PglX, partial [Eubacteriales bacterium]|nr:BREX-1 system adenine-specific DNA-methyltransferase PglX [Eubacteriales bacterium]
MIMEATAGQNIWYSTMYKQKKRLPLSAHDHRKPIRQAVFTSLPTGNRVRTAYLHCIKDSTNIDPCMGSGHILVYAFDVLYQIYLSQGYAEREIPNLILQNNLYGLDIDDRAGQLAYFALMIKARSYNRRFFRQDTIPQPKVYSFPERKWYIAGVEKWLGVSMAESDRKAAYQDLLYLAEILGDDKGKTFGSAIKIEREIDFARLRIYIHDFATGQIAMDDTDFMSQAKYFDQLIDVADVLAQKYNVVVTNPPYMGSSGMDAKLSDYVKKNYPDSKSDLSTVFMERTLELCNLYGYVAMINIPVWMFISSYDKLRTKLLLNHTIMNMLHFGRGIFGSDFGSTSFVIGKAHIKGHIGSYRRLFEKQGAVDSVEQKEKWFFEGMGTSNADSSNFAKIPGMPMAYWISSAMLAAFETGTLLGSMADSKQGLATADNDRFLRLWHEVLLSDTEFDSTSIEAAQKSQKKWFPYNKGGEFRKWYGNNDYIVNWQNNGFEIRNFKDSNGKIRSRPQNTQYYFQECFSWSLVSSGVAAFRYKPGGNIFDVAGMSCFSKNELLYLLALCNTNIVMKILEIIAPTINYQCGDIANIPVIYVEEEKMRIEKITSNNINISRTDWDSFEISWDFKLHPLIQFRQSNALWGDPTAEDFRNNGSIQLSYKAWETFTEIQFSQLKANEEELN